MGPLAEIGLLIIQTLGSLYLLIVILRFLLQLARADFYNPLSQFAVKATNPLLIPIRRIIPGIYGIDIASLVLALLIQFLIIELSSLVVGIGFLNPVQVLVWSFVGILSLTVDIFFWSLLIMVIVSWIAPHSDNPALALVRQLVEPITTPFRKLLPDMGGLDISPIFAFLALNIVRVLIQHLAVATGINGVFSRLIVGL